jgi:hypothetical protein
MTGFGYLGCSLRAVMSRPGDVGENTFADQVRSLVGVKWFATTSAAKKTQTF